MGRRKKYTPEFKAKVVIELLGDDDSLSAVAGRYQISSGLLSDRRRQLTDNAASVFSMEKDARDRRELAEEHARNPFYGARSHMRNRRGALKRTG